ncbi:MAG: DUF2280 domain-containing protein [Comamonas sp.]|uniref:DUF2280 domain-containing protein n=1 Tax=Comamonas sp. TaxID=34028 RepID=UPI002647BDF3|nr:DUF2280 domain-containing protein [Comamonas sp.]MDN5503232.1 DUF2280 domain-containing protein [Comamonas sp.]MDN5536494.1 DUF2280 domain-containing protein [Comamonas sp.]
MAVLKDPVKISIVQALACFDTPTQVADHVKQEFGLVITRQQVAMYDPTKASGHNLSKKLREIFEATRAKFLDDISTIPIAQQAYRLRVLQRNLERADSRGNSAMVSTLLEQAAKELGGAFTNRKELTGKDGQPLAVNSTNVTSTVTPEQLKEVVESVQAKF